MSGFSRSLLLLALAGCESGGPGGGDGGAPLAWARFIDMPLSKTLWGMPVVAVAAERRFVGFGGADSSAKAPLNDTWSLSMRDQSWSRVLDLTQPPPRVHHCSAYLPDQNQLLVVGGADQKGPLPPAAFALNLGTRNWLQISGSLPSGTVGCMASWLAAAGKLIVFGGSDGTSPSDETWSFDPHVGSFEKLNPPTSPPARSDGMLVEDSAGARLLLFGGSDGNVDLGDAWSFDGTTWSPLDGTPPPARSSALSVFDVAGRRWLVFGGESGGALQSDLWQLADSTWTQLAPVGEGPSARRLGGAGWDAENDELVILGGLGDGAALSDGWTLNLH